LFVKMLIKMMLSMPKTISKKESVKNANKVSRVKRCSTLYS
jgi:hypothetical protein